MAKAKRELRLSRLRAEREGQHFALELRDRTSQTIADHPKPLLAATKVARRAAPRAPLLERWDLALTARIDGWETVARQRALAPTEPGPSRSSTCSAPWEAHRPSPASSPAGELVVYTVALGSTVPPPAPRHHPQVRYICFTDRADERGDWEFVGLTRLPEVYSRHTALRLRVQPRAALEAICPERTSSLFVDTEVLIAGRVPGALDGLTDSSTIGVGLDAAGQTCGDGVTEALRGDRRHWGRALGLAARLEREGWIQTRRPDTRVVWRNHRHDGTEQFDRMWWAMLDVEAHGAVDRSILDLTFAAALGELARTGDPSDDGAALSPILQPGGLDLADVAIANPNRTIRRGKAPRRTPIPITFLSHADSRSEITTVLRGEQLSSIIRAHFDGRYDVDYSDDPLVRGRIVIVVKETIGRLRPSQIADMSRRNIAVILAWDDRLPDRRRLAAADAHMFFSYRQLGELARTLPDRPKFYVTQHVNLTLPDGRAPHDSFRAGYFGRRDNTTIPAGLETEIDVIDTPLGHHSGQQPWMSRLLEFNCHWAVRRRLIDDGGKPFMKGFVAAKYGAPIIVARDEGDAAFYLGPDYPYYVDARRDMSDTFAYAKESFGSPIWDQAREIMDDVAQQSSIMQVCRDFEAMITTITS